ncbi:tRNA 2-thiouridine(34) synthase MnmA [Candidatus Berkelbacteria bacterium]|nr:tRNA 2-thiouridine(34) synthase MnmA [Candidatus Berkelbacteria bacterium]
MKKVLVGLSGGVDSAVSAALLKEQGYEVVAVYLRAWDPLTADEALKSNCPWQDDVADASRVAAQLDIPFSVIDVREAYQAKVTKVLEREYAAGLTPNPDILCNREMKFGLMLDLAEELGFDAVATGHYARIKLLATKHQAMHNTELHRALDTKKDQTYFLWTLKADQLKRIFFPLGELTKSQVRNEALKRGLIVATKKDSQGICFLGPLKLRSYLASRLKTKPGIVVDIDGNHVGRHQGVNLYTLGQRDGLGIFGGQAKKFYVVDKSFKENILVVGEQPPESAGLTAGNLNLLEDLGVGDQLEARIRHGQEPQKCVIKELTRTGEIRVQFDTPQIAVAPGQSVVFSIGTKILGGGIISASN